MDGALVSAEGVQDDEEGATLPDNSKYIGVYSNICITCLRAQLFTDGD